MSPKAKSAGKKAAETRKRGAAGKKTAAKRKHRAAGIKAASRRKHRAAGKKAKATLEAKRQAAAAPTPAPTVVHVPPAIDRTEESQTATPETFANLAETSDPSATPAQV
jgi:hypothetical protein